MFGAKIAAGKEKNIMYTYEKTNLNSAKTMIIMPAS